MSQPSKDPARRWWRRGVLDMLDALERVGVAPGAVELLRRDYLAEWDDAPAGPPETIAEPLQAASDDAALFELLASVGCRMPESRQRE